MADGIIDKLFAKAVDRNSLRGGSVRPEQRQSAVQILDQLFGTKNREPMDLPKERKKLRYSQPAGAPEFRNIFNPGFAGKANFVDAPSDELAVLLAQKHHPKMYNRVGAFDIGQKQDDGTLAYVMPSITGAPIVSLGKSKNLGDASSTLYHELAHVLGLPDSEESNLPWPKVGTAYQVGQVADVLDRDIHLNSTPKKK